MYVTPKCSENSLSGHQLTGALFTLQMQEGELASGGLVVLLRNRLPGFYSHVTPVVARVGGLQKMPPSTPCRNFSVPSRTQNVTVPLKTKPLLVCSGTTRSLARSKETKVEDGKKGVSVVSWKKEGVGLVRLARPSGATWWCKEVGLQGSRWCGIPEKGGGGTWAIQGVRRTKKGKKWWKGKKVKVWNGVRKVWESARKGIEFFVRANTINQTELHRRLSWVSEGAKSSRGSHKNSLHAEGRGENL